MFRLAVFDLDGTLLDTRTGVARCCNAALAECGLPPFPRERYGAFCGGGLESFAKGILAAAGDTAFRGYETFCRRYLAEELRIRENDHRTFDGMRELIAHLRARGVKTAVLSNKPHKTCEEIVALRFGKDAFDLVLGGKPDLAPKPDPTGMFAVLSHFGLSPEEVFYVGDTEIDMETGRNAGVYTVAALWGYREKAALEPYKPDFWAETPREIEKLM